MVKTQVWRINQMFNGFPREDDLKLVEEDVLGLKDEEMLTEALYLSVDPYMRIFLDAMGSVGGTMIGEQISKVIESKNKTFPVGTIVRSHSGWKTRSIITQEHVNRMPELGSLPLSTALGVMGMPGMTAYFGLLEICQPKKGETLVVSGAAGAVGSLVGQIAKIKGCKVIGFAGDDDKCKWIKELGFDFAYNYKKTTVQYAMKEAAPGGVDCYFDNVGGDFTLTVLEHMKQCGRVAVCGFISQYNATEKGQGIFPFSTISLKTLLIQGFGSHQWQDRWPEGEQQMAEWIKQGKIKYRETITEGFENMYTAFLGLFKGSNTGKAIIKC